jgi:hypothetical protein
MRKHRYMRSSQLGLRHWPCQFVPFLHVLWQPLLESKRFACVIVEGGFQSLRVSSGPLVFGAFSQEILDLFLGHPVLLYKNSGSRGVSENRRLSTYGGMCALSSRGDAVLKCSSRLENYGLMV